MEARAPRGGRRVRRRHRVPRALRARARATSRSRSSATCRARVAALGERDCSVQRRHQKVIEEAPSPAVDAALRTQMSEAAVAAGEALGYVERGHGRVPARPTAASSSSWRSTRACRSSTRSPSWSPASTSWSCRSRWPRARPLPDEAIQPALRGHAIEARLYAEDAANDFLPVTGTLSRFRLPAGVRVDTGVEDGAEISPYYDPMVAKVIAHGPTRADAARLLADALARAELHGTTTNRDFLVAVLRHDEFAAGDADTVVPRPPRPGAAGGLAARRARAAHGGGRGRAGAAGGAARAGDGAGARAQRLAQRAGGAARGHVRGRRTRAGGGVRVRPREPAGHARGRRRARSTAPCCTTPRPTTWTWRRAATGAASACTPSPRARCT